MHTRALLALALVAAAATACRPAPSAAPTVAAAPPPLPRPEPKAQPEPQPETEPKPQPDPPPEVPLATARWTADTVPPLTDAERETFWGSPEDPAPAVRGGIVKELEDVHYTIGNEWALHAFHQDVAHLGGGYVGVGPDQAYLFIGWQRPHLAWLIDYDGAVLRTHALYEAIFEAAQSPGEFLAMFEPENLERANDALDAMYEGKEARGLKGLLRRHRRYYRYRLRTLRKRHHGSGAPTYLDDQETYDYVKAMLRADRVRPMLANLNESEAMAGIDAAARELKVPVRVLYVSNAEEYWDRYDPQFIANVEKLYTDASSLLLRTRLTWKINRDYMYIAQPMHAFRLWLNAEGVTRVKDVLVGHPPTKSDQVNHWRHDQPPPAASLE